MRLEAYEREHLKRLRGQLAECTVLLKSDGAFPLEGPCRLALFGNGAEFTVKGGTGSGEVNSRFMVSAERGLGGLGFEITSGAWLDAYRAVRLAAERAFYNKVLKEAVMKLRNPIPYSMGRVMREPEYEIPLNAEGDAAVYVLSRICGEGADRTEEKGDFRLTDTEVRDILALDAQFSRFMLVLNVGAPVDLTPVMGVGNILLLSQLGVDTGLILGRILLGKDNPSGKLAATWAASPFHEGAEDFGDPHDTRYGEGVYVGYRYYSTTGEEVLFPFGYGGSYTRFVPGAPQVSLEGEQVTVRVKVRNAGTRPGKETVQVYVTKPSGRLDQPRLVLAGWQKTARIPAGGMGDAVVTFPMSSLASYDSGDARWLLESGCYIIRVGADSADTTPAAAVFVPEDVTTVLTANRCGRTDFEDWKPGKPVEEKLPSGLPVLTLRPADITMKNLRFARPARTEIDPAVRRMADGDLVRMNLGVFPAHFSLMSVIGSASVTVPGAAGETRQEGGRGLVMADGPAGIRISKMYAEDQAGKHVPGTGLPESMVVCLPRPVTDLVERVNYRPRPDAEPRWQYCTALPIGTALAQSWNLELAETCGDIAGAEMERYGINLWLAPGMNIQRNPLCGRNFEYYSEDPLLSGRMAGAVVRGAQSHPRCGAVIKHFCANNQETNRMNSNSMVSERAMREIYLRGFEICIAESAPHALMTSYNLLNGMHVSENRKLSEGILRREFGFRGLIMTDWIVDYMTDRRSVHPNPVIFRIAAAGCELIMPGSKRHCRLLQKALAEGRIPRRQLEENVSRLVRKIRELT